MTDLDNFYAEAIEKADAPWALNDYGSERSQKRRFAVATESLGIRSGDKVVDVGCGSGEYARYLWSVGLDVKYTGYDSVPAMVELSKRYSRNIGSLDAFVQPIGFTDFAVCLGVLGVVPGTEEERMAKFFRLFENLCDNSAYGVAVTVQTYQDGLDKSGLRWYMETEQLSEGFFGLKEKHPDFGWQLRSDYHPHDSMIIGTYKSF